MYINKSNIKLMTFCNPYKKMFVVYKITNPIGQVYVGVTSNLYKRLFQHSNSHKYNDRLVIGLIQESIIKYGWDEHVIEILWHSNTSTKKDAFEVEMNMIITHKSHFIDNPGVGLNKRRGNYDNSYLRGNKHCIPVCQYDMATGKFIQQFKSSNEAARALRKKKFAVTCISNARMGRSEFAFGYYWSADKALFYKSIKITEFKNKTKIIKMNHFGTTIHDVYNTVKEAAMKNKMSLAGMLSAIKELNIVNDNLYIGIKAS